LQEAWMRHADAILGDDHLVSAVYEALGTRHPQSRTRGRRGAPAEMVLRLLVLKHLRNWSYATVEREVRGNLVYRDFTRIGGGKVPDAKTMGRWGVAVGPAVIADLHRRLIDGAAAARGRGPQDACGYDRGGDQHPLSDR
jgi:transposase, IS5 family